MSAQLVVFAAGAVPAFALGWWLRGLIENKGDTMDRATSRLTWIDRLFGWFSHGNRLVGFTLVVGLIGIGAMIYTWNADQQSEDRSDDVIACIAQYVEDTNTTQLARTEASVAASDARYAFDIAEPGPAREAAELRYRELYTHYVEVRAQNPLPEFTRDYCQAAVRGF